MAEIIEKAFASTPPQIRTYLRRLKYHLLAKMSPSAYWNLAAGISAKAAICTDCTDEAEFFASAQRELELLKRKRLLAPGVQVLNIGCGIGRIEKALAPEVFSVTGVDVSRRMIELARDKVSEQNVSFQVVDGKSLTGILDMSFDLCVSFMVLQHIPRTATASYVAEVRRVLKRGGKFLFQLPLSGPDRDAEPPSDHPFGMRYYSREEVANLLRASDMTLLEQCDIGGEPLTDVANIPLRYEFYLAQRSSTAK